MQLQLHCNANSSLQSLNVARTHRRGGGIGSDDRQKTSESEEKDAEGKYEEKEEKEEQRTTVEEEEEEEEQEEECGPEHQMVPDEEVERTTIEAFMGVLAKNSPKPTKKKRKQVDPSSLVKNVKNETRIEKKEEGFVYEDLNKVKKNKQEEMHDVIPKWNVEKTKLGKLLEEEDKALLNLFYKDAVEKFMKELEATKSNQPQFYLLTPIESIFKDGTQLRTVQQAPQQNVASVDCGPVVCYIMKRIAELEEIPQKLEKEDVLAFKVYLFHKILHDEPRSWMKEKWQDKQLAQDLTSDK
ncbi:hypothetical protein RHMOL_Rhmol03G0105600 [Rhododendron molle]|uniref:Uncharacterized protein n=1 Tax=Rhododendron molle TaxID=49168 RepID=A0ACC0PD40_RHOML|nr:hypothetical protein RHMOL_Rhmol03G0105600 [Rhododendron molle]